MTHILIPVDPMFHLISPAIRGLELMSQVLYMEEENREAGRSFWFCIKYTVMIKESSVQKPRKVEYSVSE